MVAYNVHASRENVGCSGCLPDRGVVGHPKQIVAVALVHGELLRVHAHHHPPQIRHSFSLVPQAIVLVGRVVEVVVAVAVGQLALRGVRHHLVLVLDPYLLLGKEVVGGFVFEEFGGELTADIHVQVVAFVLDDAEDLLHREVPAVEHHGVHQHGGNRRVEGEREAGQGVAVLALQRTFVGLALKEERGALLRKVALEPLCQHLVGVLIQKLIEPLPHLPIGILGVGAAGGGRLGVEAGGHRRGLQRVRRGGRARLGDWGGLGLVLVGIEEDACARCNHREHSSHRPELGTALRLLFHMPSWALGRLLVVSSAAKPRAPINNLKQAIIAQKSPLVKVAGFRTVQKLFLFLKLKKEYCKRPAGYKANVHFAQVLPGGHLHHFV